jgi:spore maturation protein CgeB
LGVGTILHCRDFYALKMRDFDAPMSGSFYLTHDNPDLRLLYGVGKELETYGSTEECIEKVLYYLAHDQERERIAAAGLAAAARKHTWDHRFAQLMDALGLPAGSQVS